MVRDSIRIEALGTPTAVLVTEPFKRLADFTARTAGLEALPIVGIPHPQAGLPAAVIAERVGAVVHQVVQGLMRLTRSEYRPPGRGVASVAGTKMIAIAAGSDSAALHAVNELFYENRWTDGFPIVPPTEETVRWMLAATDRDPTEVVAVLPPANGRATIRGIAINSVMAGAAPAYLPVIIAAIEALGAPSSPAGEQRPAARGLEMTSAPLAPLLIVNGPLAKELKIEAGFGCFSPGHRANATIGRAVRLILTNIGGAYAGINDLKVQGSSQAFTFCCAEREEHPAYDRRPTPWTALHVERGFPPTRSTVTVGAASPPISVADNENCGPKLLDRVAAVISNLALSPYVLDGRFILLLGATHAAYLSDAGLSKDDIRDYIYARAVLPWGVYRERYPGSARIQLQFIPNPTDESTMVHVYREPENVDVIVAGGDGPYSQLVGVSHTTTREIRQGEREP